MEGIKTNKYVDCNRNIFGSEIYEILLKDNIICFNSLTFNTFEKQNIICKMLAIPAKKIYGIEFIKKKKVTNNWFEKIFFNKEEWIRIYY